MDHKVKGPHEHLDELRRERDQKIVAIWNAHTATLSARPETGDNGKQFGQTPKIPTSLRPLSYFSVLNCCCERIAAPYRCPTAATGAARSKLATQDRTILKRRFHRDLGKQGGLRKRPHAPTETAARLFLAQCDTAGKIIHET